MSKVFWIKRSMIDQKRGTNNCTLNFLCDFFANQDAYEKNGSTFWSSYEKWNQNRVLALELAILGHVLFPNLEGVAIRLLQFQEQIEQGHTFFPSISSQYYKSFVSQRELFNTLRMMHLIFCRTGFLNTLWLADCSKQNVSFKKISSEHTLKECHGISSKVERTLAHT